MLQNPVSNKDLDIIRTGLMRCQRVEVDRSLGPLRIRLSVQPAANIWPVADLVRLEMWYGAIYSSQLFDSVEGADRALKEVTSR